MTDFVSLHLGAVGEVGVPHLSISLRISESFSFVMRECDEEKKGGGPNSREDITNPAEGPCMSALESHRLVGNLHIPVTGSKCSQFSKYQLFQCLGLWEFPINVWPDKEQSCFTSVAATNCKRRWEAAHASSRGWEVWFRVQRWGLPPHTSSRVSPLMPVYSQPTVGSFIWNMQNHSGQSSQSPDFLHSRQISINLPVSWQRLRPNLAPCLPDPKLPQLFSVVSSEPPHPAPSCLHLRTKCPLVPVCDFRWA